MAGAKKYHKAPIMIAGEVAEKLKDSAVFSEVNAVAPGFLNLKVSDVFLCDYLKGMEAADKFGLETPGGRKDRYRGLRRTECGKAPPCGTSSFRGNQGKASREGTRYAGYKVIGDIHLGDWGLQMGLTS